MFDAQPHSPALVANDPSQSPAVVGVPVPPTTSTSVKPRRRANTHWYDRGVESLANLAALAFAAALWYVGAQFTLAFFAGVGLPAANLGIAKWLIPVGISAIQIKFWPHSRLKPHLLWMFLGVTSFDLATSVFGGKQWLAGRLIVDGITIPATGAPPWVLSLIAACVCTFWPERLARTAVGELRRIWIS